MSSWGLTTGRQDWARRRLVQEADTTHLAQQLLSVLAGLGGRRQRLRLLAAGCTEHRTADPVKTAAAGDHPAQRACSKVDDVRAATGGDRSFASQGALEEQQRDHWATARSALTARAHRHGSVQRMGRMITQHACGVTRRHTPTLTQRIGAGSGIQQRNRLALLAAGVVPAELDQVAAPRLQPLIRHCGRLGWACRVSGQALSPAASMAQGRPREQAGGGEGDGGPADMSAARPALNSCMLSKLPVCGQPQSAFSP